MFGPKDLDFCFFDKCLGGVAQSTSGLLRRVTPALLRSLAMKKPADVLPYSVCIAEDPANRAREEKKRFRSRQTASKQGTNHSDSYSRRIDLPRSNAVAREARTFAYVPFTTSDNFLFKFMIVPGSYRCLCFETNQLIWTRKQIFKIPFFRGCGNLPFSMVGHFFKRLAN